MPYARNRDSFETVSARRRQRIAELQAQLEYINGVPVHPDPPGGHGSASAYNAAGCRCEVCRAGAHEQYIEYRDRARARRPKRPVPGTTVDMNSVFSFRQETTAANED